ncbi:MAG TPA: GNAT family N-acetyltransferase [Steroidobacteraceae bacterium]|jgi:GNAT superfamily N-acetyltransferase|nr:GNAT family N-acetyltransferase [Steroidobacteraceae bacterium]
MLRLRPAQAADVAAIFALIGELADYERLRYQMVGSAEDLRRHLFGEPRFASAMVALWDEAVVGFALYFFNYSTFLCRPGLYLEDLFVRADHRGRGIGRALLAALEQRARELGCGRLEWAVLDWNRGAIDFYRRFGARPNEGWTLFRKELV